MKKIATYLLFLFLALPGGKLFAQTVVIPDLNFRQFLVTYYPSVMNPAKQLIIANAAAVTGTLYCGDQNIYNLEGIQYFTGLSALRCFKNKLTTLPDLSGMTNLTSLECYENQLTGLPSLSSLTNLQTINADGNKISYFPIVNGCTSLTNIYISRNNLTSVPDLSQLPNLQILHCYGNQITSIGKTPASLKTFYFGDNLLTTFPDISLSTGISDITAYTNRLTSIPDLSSFTFLTIFNVGTNKILSLPASLSTMTWLTTLVLDNNELTSIPDLSPLTQLATCRLDNNSLTFEDLQAASANPNFSSWQIGPQDSVTVTPVYKGTEHQKLTISLNLDAAVSGLTFSWYHNGTFKAQTSQSVLDFASLNKSDNGTYYCIVSSSDPLFASLNLVSKPFTVLVQPDFRYEEELVLSPDGDGRNDEILFEEKGQLKVYDSVGNLLDQQTSPCYWKGTTQSGKELTTGFYVVRINDATTYGITIVR